MWSLIVGGCRGGIDEFFDEVGIEVVQMIFDFAADGLKAAGHVQVTEMVWVRWRGQVKKWRQGDNSDLT